MSLLAHEEDSATSDQDEQEDPKPMGFAFKAAGAAEQALFTGWGLQQFLNDGGQRSFRPLRRRQIGPLDQEQDDQPARDQPIT